MKVYCNDCKFFKVDERGLEHCHGWIADMVDTHRRRVTIYACPSRHNDDNQCPDWHPSIKHRIWRLFYADNNGNV